MRRFDICPLRSPRGGLVVVLQHDSLDHLQTCIVAPLVEPFIAEKDPKVRPIIAFEGRKMQLQTDRLAAVPRGAVAPTVGSAETEQDAIKDAIDRLFIGF